jgi:hypothetical protein
MLDGSRNVARGGPNAFGSGANAPDGGAEPTAADPCGTPSSDSLSTGGTGSSS